MKCDNHIQEQDFLLEMHQNWVPKPL